MSSPVLKNPQEQRPDAGHIPITEEMDSARWTLPPIVPVLIAAIVLGVIVGVYVYSSKKPPTSSGAVSRVVALPLHVESKGSIAPGMSGTIDQNIETSDSILIAIALDVKNAIQRPMYIKSLQAKLVTDKGELIDDAAPASDYDRLLQAYPQLALPNLKPFQVESSIAPGTTEPGVMIVSFPITRDGWDKRKSLQATVNFYDHSPLVMDATQAASATEATLPTKVTK